MSSHKYPAPRSFELKMEKETAARVAAFLRGIVGGNVWNLGGTGVRADWMEQDGPALSFAAETAVSSVPWNEVPTLGSYINTDTFQSCVS